MKNVKLFEGIVPAALTMFTRDGKINEAGTASHIEYLLKNGASGIVACGTSGEFIAMTVVERLRVIELIIETVAGRVPVIAGTGHYSTKLTIEMTQKAEQIGADAVLIILPYYQKPPKSSIISHYRTLRKHTSLPIWVYNNPLFAGCEELTSRDLTALAKENIIQGVKSTFASVVPVHELLYFCDSSFRVFYGSFQSPMEALLAGAHGWISGFLNFLTSDCVSLYKACVACDVVKARKIWNFLQPFKHIYTHQLLGPVNDLAIYRAGLEIMGHTGGYSRLPFKPLTGSQRKILESLMKKHGII